MDYKDYYKILGVPRNADGEDRSANEPARQGTAESNRRRPAETTGSR
jgi:hypothetical protein